MSDDLLTVRVQKKELAAVDIYRYELVSPEGKALPAFTAGAHVDVHIRDGLIRQYSLSGSPQNTDVYEIGVLRDPASRGGSIAMHDDIQEGDLINISMPRNHFPIEPLAKQHILLAGGIGVTPILCMAEQLSHDGADFIMHYCSRSESRAAYRERIAGSRFAHRAYFHYDDGAAEQKLDLKRVLGRADSRKHLYICGPTGFLDFVRNSAKEAGWPDANVHFEYFGAEVAASTVTDSFQVKIASSGVVVRVNPDESIVEVLAQHGVTIPVSCEQGVCGTCLTGVLEGTPEHLDHYLTDEERADNDQILLCCSRSKSPLLVLDL